MSNVNLQLLINELNTFLEENPEMVKHQLDIGTALMMIGSNPVKRLETLTFMMRVKINELESEMKKLQELKK